MARTQKGPVYDPQIRAGLFGAPGGVGLLNLPERLQPYGWALLVVTTPWLYPQAFPADLEAFQEAQRQKRQAKHA